MLEVRENSALTTTAARRQDISSWQAVDITKVNSRAKKRFIRYRSAVVAYFTTDKPVEEITARYYISSNQLLKMTADCLKQHEDGTPWGFRALLPRAQVKDYAPQPVAENTVPADPDTHEESSPKEDPSAATLETPIEDDRELEATADTLETPIEDDRGLEATVGAAEQTVENDCELEVTADTLETPIEDDKEEPPADILELPVEDDHELEITTKRLAIRLDAPAEPAATRSAAQGKGEDEQVHPVASDEPTQEATTVTLTPTAGEEQALKGSAVARLPAVDLALPTQRTGPHILPKFAKHGKHSTLVKIAQRRRMVRRRWIRDTQDKGRQKSLLRVVSIAIVVVILLGLLLPISVALAAYNVYNNVDNLTHNGINHLLTVKDLLPVSKSDPMAALNAGKLEQAQNELKAAEADFEQLQQLTNRPDVQSLVQQFSPRYAGQLVMARHLVQVALDVSRMGQELSGVGVIAAGILHSSPLASNSAQPLISVQDVAQVKGAIVHALFYIDDIQQNMSQVQLNALPISAKQKAQLASVLTELPAIRNMIVQNQNLVDMVTWLLGVGQPRHFLVQTMDNAELRPGGGFTGQYGLLTIDNGRMDPFTLRDVALLDYAGNGMELGRQAPPEYRSWMNFGNWGLRDSNLSGDYPTTARMNMQVFQEEGGGPVDGDIAFTPTFIGHIIDITGPIRVAEYNETITEANLADRLHYYQQNYNAIAIEHQKSNDSSHQARKAFTSLLGKLLLNRVRHLPTKQLLNVIKGAAKDLQSRDLEIYFNNPTAEQWLSDHGYSSGLDTFSKRDGFVLVQANISISKASQYVHTTEQDAITLDAQDGATHNLTITLDYNQTGPIYGYDTYADYMRVYVPRSSQLQGGDGFYSGHALCSATVGKNRRGSTPVYAGCNSRAPGNSIYCPSGNYSLGMRGYQQPWPVDSISGPTAITSDLPGRGMYGGLTATPKNCTATITLSWYVPNAVKHNGKHLSYTLFVQKQGGYIPTLDVTVDTSAIKGLKPLSFKGSLTADRAFTLIH